MQNLLDKRIERLAYEYFSSFNLNQSLIEFNIKELQICIERGYNSRAQIFSLLKKAVA